jgi:hypothetical protein
MLRTPFSCLEKPRNTIGRDVNSMAHVLKGFDGCPWAGHLPLQLYVFWHCLDSCSAILKTVLLERP